MESVKQFGIMAVAVGAFVEGETALILAGAAISMGILDFWPVVFAAMTGSLTGDQLFFWLGRLKGGAWLSMHPRFGQRVRRMEEVLIHRQVLLLCSYRFIYGIRGVIPFAFGISKLCWKYFLAANLITASLWSVGMALIGRFAGSFLSDPHSIAFIPVIVAGCFILVIAFQWIRARFKSIP